MPLGEREVMPLMCHVLFVQLHWFSLPDFPKIQNLLAQTLCVRRDDVSSRVEIYVYMLNVTTNETNYYIYR